MKVAAAVAAVVLAVSGAAGSAAAAAPAATAPLVASAAAGASSLTPLPGGPTRPPTDFSDGRYIVTLTNPAASTYQGGINGFSATKPSTGDQMNARSAPVTSYSDYLSSTQRDIAGTVGANVDYSYTLALNGFSANLTADQASKLTQNKSVARVTKDEIKQIQSTEGSSISYLGLDGDTGVWAQYGGIAAAGKGIVVGDIDTGIAPENPSFAGSKLSTTPSDEPYIDTDPAPEFANAPITFTKADGQTFHGECVTGQQFTAADCSTKIVGAHYYLDGFGKDNIESAANGEYASPRDGDSHGSHTASTAAGNNGVEASIEGDSFGTISGVAPAAKISVYKVCWTGKVADGIPDGCSNADMIAAIDQAVADGVDVLNFSIGGSSAATTVSDTDLAFYGAASAGIFVAASAGNSGPGASTLDNGSPWYTTVAASSIPNFEATATFGNGTALAGGSTTVEMGGAGPVSGSLVRADLVKAPLATEAAALQCGPNTLDPAKVKGTIVFCARGGVDRVAKSAEVLRAGGIGMLLVNPTNNSVDLDEHSVPTIVLNGYDYDATFAYAGTAGATVTLTKGNTTGVATPVPVLAGFSSHGPVTADGSDILKPDISAPGVGILAAGANPANGDPKWVFESGTSMSAPHIAGLAALYLGVHPLATPAEIKSAMMTTAHDTIDYNRAPVEDPFAQGAGQITATSYLNPGLLYLNGPADWDSYIAGIGYDFHGATPIDPSDLNLASIAIGSLNGTQTVTRTVTATQPGTYTASAAIAGVDTVVSPSTLSFGAAGESQSYTVTFTRTDAALNTFATGYLTWAGDNGISVRSPLAVQPVPLVAPASVSGVGSTGSVVVPVTPGSTAPILLTLQGLAKGDHLVDPAGGADLDGHTAVGVVGDAFEFPVTVAGGTALARFDLTSVIPASEGADLDLYVDLLDENGDVATEWSSATGAADERVDITNPDAGNYVVRAEIFSLPTSAATGALDIDVFAVAAGATAGGFTATPSIIDGVQGVETSYTASWTGLDYASKYLGLVSYGDSGLSTVVDVTTEAIAPPTIPPTEPPVDPTPTPTDTAAPPVVPSVTPVPGDPGATPAPGAGSGPWNDLASTGLSTALPIGLAGVLLLAGISALIVRRRRAHAAVSDSGE